ncbi:Abi family protein [Thiocystis violacea]|uniref:Abi family protein n=1 Tax=Thiocystis violacea TaxID=13725 RepID=UPI0019084DC6|nr:Abi family protein [Thiocystis violacea]MBK1720309.1 abortive phage resistance protein [Thiocystis violacea]
MAYSKPWKSHNEQLDLLISRGLIVTDRPKALECLQRIGYYRLSGYWFPFRERSGPLTLLGEHGGKPARPNKVETIALDAFRAGATFESAVKLYVFDKKLRLLALDALERIEIALRVDISHTLGKIDRFAYLDPALFHPDFSQQLHNSKGVTRHHEWLGKHARLINESKEEFVRHNKTKYGLPLAIWVACEVWDFGTMSRLYDGMREQEQDAISARYGIRNGRIFATWLRGLNYLRNVCAHHSRLWNRNIVDQPRLPSAAEVPWVAYFEQDSHARARCYLLLCIARHLLTVVHPSSTWPTRLRDHLGDFPDLTHLDLNLAGMGAPTDWERHWTSMTARQ